MATGPLADVLLRPSPFVTAPSPGPVAAVPDGGPPPAGVARRAMPWLALAAGYVALSVALWWHVWAGHPAGTVTCLCGDPAQSVWFIGWVAHALAHLQDPLLSTAAAHPGGVNLLANQSSVLVGVLMAPVTWLFGPVAGLNAALTLAAPADALAAVALCRRFTGWGPAAAGGLVFGFSPLVVSELAYAHLADTVLVFVPLIVLCLHELLVRRQGRPARWGLALAAAVVAQYFVSAEVLAITAVISAVMLVVVVVVAVAGAIRSRRPTGGPSAAVAPGSAARSADSAPGGAGRQRPWADSIRGLAVAGVVAVTALAWPVWFALDGPRHISGAVWVGTADFGSPWSSFFTVPAASTAEVAFTHYGGYLGAPLPPASYLGPGLLLVLAVGLVAARRRPMMWVAALALVVSAALSLGSMLLPFDWYSSWWLPWRLFGSLPVLQSVVPQRVMVTADLAAAVGLAVTLDAVAGWRGRAAGGRIGGAVGGDGPGPRHRRPRRAWVGRWPAAVVSVALGAGALLPGALVVGHPFVTSAVRLPGWFTRAAPKLPTGSVLLTLPFPAGRVSEAMAWQAVDGFSFDLAGAYAKLPGPTGQADYGGLPGSAEWLLAQLTEPTGALPVPTPAAASAVRAAIRRWHVTAVVATGRQLGALYPAQYAAAIMTAVMGRAPLVEDGAWVWRLPADEGPPLAVSPSALDACVGLADHHTVPLDTVPDCVVVAGGG